MAFLDSLNITCSSSQIPAGLAGCEDYYSVIILCSLLLAFVVAAAF